MRARARWVGAACALALVLAACGSSTPSTPSATRPSAGAWPTHAQASACAKNSPSGWMGCLAKAHPAFAGIPLSYLALPGAENAGTFNLDAQALDTQTGSACTTVNKNVATEGVKTQRFSATQDQTITRQLDGGVRWIDLQVGYNGGGNPITGWRVTQNLYSNWPLSEYLDEVANWAVAHPSEAVVVDLSTICYDHDPSETVDQGLWANFAAKSAEGAGPATIADVAARPSSFGGSLATATLRQLATAKHNVVVLVPSSAKDVQVLRDRYGVDPVRAASPGHGVNGATEVERSDPRVAPTSPDQFPSANTRLASYPKSAAPGLGSLQGRGLYVSKLAYELKGASASAQDAIFKSFVGLISSEGMFRAWMSGLWSGAYPHALAQWGSATNVVVADGVEFGGFLPAVIERNAR